jgi:hypothetical protein
MTTTRPQPAYLILTLRQSQLCQCHDGWRPAGITDVRWQLRDPDVGDRFADVVGAVLAFTSRPGGSLCHDWTAMLCCETHQRYSWGCRILQFGRERGHSDWTDWYAATFLSNSKSMDVRTSEAVRPCEAKFSHTAFSRTKLFISSSQLLLQDFSDATVVSFRTLTVKHTYTRTVPSPP